MADQPAPLMLCQLPYRVVKQLGDILDASNDWKRLAGFMGLTHEEVLHLQSRLKYGESPTAALISSLGTLGRNTNNLFDLLLFMNHVRALEILLPLVDEASKGKFRQRKFHAHGSAVVSNNASFVRSPNLASSNAQAAGGVSSLKVVAKLSKLGLEGGSSKVSGSSSPRPGNPNFVSPAKSPCAGGLHSKDKNLPACSGNAHSCTPRSVTKAVDSVIEASLKATLHIPYADLSKATKEFNKETIVGRGGYGVVHFGVWLHTEIAVKRLQAPEGKQRLKQSLCELQALSTYRHDNILPLYGYSLDGSEPCLVYQFMSGGSLEDRLLGKNKRPLLTWQEKYDVILGAAKGLNYLHTCGQEPLIHGDIKSANILLDDHLVPKIGDFGLARKGVVEVFGETPPLIASHIKGTLAYLPPEFLRSKHLSTKLDVYSFGVVLYEVATGSRAHSESRRPENLVEFVRVQVVPQRDQLADKRHAADDSDLTNFNLFIDLGLKCCQNDPDQRPTMDALLADLLNS